MSNLLRNFSAGVKEFVHRIFVSRVKYFVNRIFAIKVFVSATSKDLKSYREDVCDVLLTRGIHPETQEHFPPDYRTVTKMLWDKIADCDAVVCLIGLAYGFEPKRGTDPTDRPSGERRRSYTQIEYDIARELKKRNVFIFMTDEKNEKCAFPDPMEAEELRELQRAYREEIKGRAEVRNSFCTHEDLREKVAVIQFRPPRLVPVFFGFQVAILVVIVAITYMGIHILDYMLVDQPTVTGVNPLPDQTGVAATTTVKATFSKPVEEKSISFELTNDTTHANVPTNMLSLDSTKRTATLKPTEKLASNTTYNATVRAKDLSGNWMSGTVSWQFKTPQICKDDYQKAVSLMEEADNIEEFSERYKGNRVTWTGIIETEKKTSKCIIIKPTLKAPEHQKACFDFGAQHQSIKAKRGDEATLEGTVYKVDDNGFILEDSKVIRIVPGDQKKRTDDESQKETK